MRRKLRWTLTSPDGDQVRSGLSFGAFEIDQAIQRAVSASSPAHGDTLDVYVDGKQVCSLRIGADTHASE